MNLLGSGSRLSRMAAAAAIERGRVRKVRESFIFFEKGGLVGFWYERVYWVGEVWFETESVRGGDRKEIGGGGREGVFYRHVVSHAFHMA